MITVYRSLATRRDVELESRIREMVGGPPSFADEKEGSAARRARDTSFELQVVSLLVRANIAVRFETSADVSARFCGRNFVFECKRPQKSMTVERNVKTASKQIATRYLSSEIVRTRGIIALDFSKVINPQSARFVPLQGYTLQETLDLYIYLLEQDFSPVWHRHATPKVVGVLARIAFAAADSWCGGALAYCYRWRLSAISQASDADKDAMRKLVQAISETDLVPDRGPTVRPTG